MTAEAASQRASEIRRLTDAGQIEAALLLTRQAMVGAQGEAQGDWLLLLAQAHLSGSQVSDALRAAMAAFECFTAVGHAGGRCDALVLRANVFRAVGDHHAALSAIEEAEPIARALEDPRRMAAVLRVVGICCSILRRHQHALSCLGEAADLAAASGDEATNLQTRLSAINVRNRQASDGGSGGLDVLLDPWLVLAQDCAAAGNLRLEAMALGNHAITLRELGRADEAAAALQALLPRYQALSMRPNEAVCLNELALCHEARAEAKLARNHYRSAVGLLRNEGSLDDLQQALEGLSRAEEACGDLAAALAALREVRGVDRRKSDDAARAAVMQRELRIELSRLTNQWARQATEDALTGLANRRGLERWLAEQLPGVEMGRSLALILMDVDHFKQVNDGFGHDTGDEVLKRLALLMRAHCRVSDLAVRYGGEEFVLALAGLALAEAAEIAERLRAAVQADPWSQVRQGLSVTLSAGVTCASEAAGAAALLTLADQRLYIAKLSGRNRVQSAG